MISLGCTVIARKNYMMGSGLIANLIASKVEQYIEVLNSKEMYVLQ